MTMEGNKDEADRCCQIAVMAMRVGDLDKATKMLRKAQTLYPSERAEKLLVEVDKARKCGGDSADNEKSQESPPTVRRRQGAEQVQVEKTYTEEQLVVVKKVIKCKDYYDVLSVSKEATDSEIKKAYKKLALQLHPDKNSAPGAAEAFKKVGKAVATLTDAEKRKTYDVYGPDEENSARQQQGSGDYYESYFSADDIYNMYFSNSFHSHQYGQTAANSRRRFYRNQEYEWREGGGDHQQMTFALILMVIVVLSMTSFFRSDPPYSLAPTSEYSISKYTSNFRIPYYVKSNFDTEYQGSIGRLELSVEEQYITNMKHNCFRERNYREMMIARARSFGNKAQLAQAQELGTPACDSLHRLGKYKY